MWIHWCASMLNWYPNTITRFSFNTVRNNYRFAFPTFFSRDFHSRVFPALMFGAENSTAFYTPANSASPPYRQAIELKIGNILCSVYKRFYFYHVLRIQTFLFKFQRFVVCVQCRWMAGWMWMSLLNVRRTLAVHLAVYGRALLTTATSTHRSSTVLIPTWTRTRGSHSTLEFNCTSLELSSPTELTTSSALFVRH